MSLPAALKNALAECAEKPDDQQILYKVESAYWAWLADAIAELVRGRKDHRAFLEEHRDLIDFGFSPDLIPGAEAIRTELRAPAPAGGFLRVTTFTEYLSETIRSITEGNRAQFIQRDITAATMHADRALKEINEIQKARRLDVMAGLAGLGAVTASAQAEAMDQVDELLRQSLETKKAISQGVFVSVDKKREHAQREQQIVFEQDRVEKSIRGISDAEAVQRIRQASKQVLEGIGRVIDLRDSAAKLEKQMRKIEQEQSSISPIEIENRVREEITYLRDLIKLSAKRLHISSCPCIRPKDPYFTFT